MMTIGVTGGSGAGKTTVLHEAQRRGALILDCDEIYHQLLETSGKMLAEIGEAFPGSVENGVLNRKKLGKLVFNDPAALKELNAITHRYVRREVRRRLRQSDASLAVIDAIGLIESGLHKLCDGPGRAFPRNMPAPASAHRSRTATMPADAPIRSSTIIPACRTSPGQRASCSIKS